HQRALFELWVGQSSVTSLRVGNSGRELSRFLLVRKPWDVAREQQLTVDWATDASRATSKLFMRPCTDERFHSSSGRDFQVHDGKVIPPGIVRSWFEKERTAL